MVRAAPFQRTMEFAVNPLPFTVIVRAEEPAGAVLGESELTLVATVPEVLARLLRTRRS